MGDEERDNLGDKLDQMLNLQKKHDEKLTSIDDLLRGTYERKGLITRVTGLEEVDASRRCWYRLTIGAAITSAAGAIVSWLKNGGVH